MSMLTASTVVNSPQLPAARRVGQQGQKLKLTGSSLGSGGVRFPPFDGKVRPFKSIKAGPVGLGTNYLLTELRKPVMDSTQTRSSSFICAAALSARCSEGQGQTATIQQKSPTITHTPVKDTLKTPDLDNSGPGLPPGGGDGGGGGGGGGGGNWSGGFAFFGFLLFLGFLKDKESEGPYRDNRRR